MTKDLKKRSMEDLKHTMREYSHWEGLLRENERDLLSARKRVVELEERRTDLEAKMHKEMLKSLEIAEDIKAGK